MIVPPPDGHVALWQALGTERHLVDAYIIGLVDAKDTGGSCLGDPEFQGAITVSWYR